MNRRGCRALLIAAAFSCSYPASAWEGAARQQFVHADMLRVRARAEPSAEVIARLSINTPVQVLGRNGAWARVKTRSEPVVSGWASAALIGNRPLKPADLREQLAAATGQARSSLRERLVALDPANRQHHEQLRDEYVKAGKHEAAKLVTERLAGNLPTYVAECLESKRGRYEAVLIASFSSRAGWSALFGSPGLRNSSALERIGAELGGLPWLALKGGGSRGMPASPFPAPAVQTFEKTFGDEPAQAIRLGPCDAQDAGWIYVSGHIIRTNSSDTNASRLQEVKAELDRRALSAGPFVWARQMFGDHLLAIGTYSAAGGREQGVIGAAIPPAPRPPAVQAVATRAAGHGGSSLYFAIGNANEATVVAAYGPDAGLGPRIAVLPSRTGVSCSEIDATHFSASEKEALREFEAGVEQLQALRNRTDLAWYHVGDGAPVRIPLAEIQRRELSCTEFPNLRKDLTIGGWSLPFERDQHVLYASAPLRAVSRPKLARSSLEPQVQHAMGKAAGPERWLVTPEGTATFGFIPFDEVVCEPAGEDQMCGGDTGYFVVLLKKDGRHQSLRVVTSTTGC